jgi:hypothetical protein
MSNKQTKKPFDHQHELKLLNNIINSMRLLDENDVKTKARIFQAVDLGNKVAIDALDNLLNRYLQAGLIPPPQPQQGLPPTEVQIIQDTKIVEGTNIITGTFPDNKE